MSDLHQGRAGHESMLVWLRASDILYVYLLKLLKLMAWGRHKSWVVPACNFFFLSSEKINC